MIRIFSLIKNNWFPITVVSLAAVTFLSLWPLPELPEMPGTDKTHHFIAYGLLMFPSALRRPKKWLLFALFFVGYSGLIELIQPMVNRYGEWLDLAANVGGILSGIVVAGLVNVLVKMSGSRSNFIA
jgi:VanZ family protein